MSNVIETAKFERSGTVRTIQLVRAENGFQVLVFRNDETTPLNKVTIYKTIEEATSSAKESFNGFKTLLATSMWKELAN